jgi:membrane protease YdiL (CAAX protease family)
VSLDPEAGSSNFPNLWQGTGVALAYLALSTWLNTGVAVTAEAFHFPLWTSMLPGLFLGFPLALTFGLWLGRLDLWDILAFRPVRPGVWVPLLIAHAGFFILIQTLAHGMEWGMDRLLPETFRLNLLKESGPMGQASAPILALLFAGAAIPEEVLFRGLILRGLLRRHRPMVAIWLSTALFVIAHGNPLQFPVALMIGACAGWYYQATGSLWPGLAAHGLHNLCIGLMLEPENITAGSLVVSPLPPLAWILVSPFLAGAGLFWLRWQFNRAEPLRTGVLRLSCSPPTEAEPVPA